MAAVSKKIREAIYWKYGGKCAYCGQELPKRWHVDHIDPILRDVKIKEFIGDNSKSNLNPACPSCNISKGRMSLEDWRTWLKNHIRSLNLYNKNYRMVKAFGLIIETNNPVVFYFEGFNHENYQI